MEPNARVELVRRPRHLAAVLPSLNDALLFVELEGSGPARWHCGVWLSTWALAPHRVQELQAAPNRTMARVLPESG